MNRLAKIYISLATLVGLGVSPLAAVSAAPFQGVGPNSVQVGEVQTSYGGDVEQVRHKGRYHRRHRHYKKHRQHRSNRYCHYSPRKGKMVCRPGHRYR